MDFSKKSEMGIGTLILFIAMILVAAIAAGVLIQTATSLQSRALETGKRSTIEVSTALKTVLIKGEDASFNRSISYIWQQVKLVAGSDSVKFNDAIVTLDLKDISQEYLYDQNHSCTGVNGSNYRVNYLKNCSSHMDGYVVVGDVVEMCYRSPRPIFEDESVRINFIPKVGSVMTTSFSTPSNMISKRVSLYP
jgi:flagellin-like protein